jgi:hypothetical protein
LHQTGRLDRRWRSIFDRLAELRTKSVYAALFALDPATGRAAVARALAARRGSSQLPNLQQISPQALRAVREKEDICIPRKLIEQKWGKVPATKKGQSAKFSRFGGWRNFTAT